MKTKRALAERMTNQTQVHEHNQYAMICVTMNKRLLAEMHKRAAAMQVSIGELAVRMMERYVGKGQSETAQVQQLEHNGKDQAR